MIQHRPRWAALLLAVGGLVASCTPAGNPDPDNRRLHTLAAEPIFASLPSGANRTSYQENPAKYQSNLFSGSGWHGPSVIMKFTSSQPVKHVYRFYNEQAEKTGWTPWQRLSNGLPRSWTKTIAGKRSIIFLYDFDIHSTDITQSGTPTSYTLSGST